MEGCICASWCLCLHYRFSFRFSRGPEQWRSRQKSKLTVYKEFLAEFNEADCGLPEMKNPPVDSSKKASQQTDMKKMRQEIDNVLSSFPTSDVSKKLKRKKKDRENHGDNNVEQKPSPVKKKRKHQQ